MKSSVFAALALTFSIGGPTIALADGEPSLVTHAAELVEVPREYRLDGTVEAINQSTVNAQTSGQVEEILFDVDDYVKQGDLILRLRDTEQRARMAQAKAELSSAAARLQETEDEYERSKQLFARELISEATMDKATTALDAAPPLFISWAPCFH